MPKRVICYLLLLFVVLTACDSDPLDVDVSNHAVNLHFERIDSVLFSSEQADLETTHKRLLKEQGVFYELYFSQMLGLGNANDPSAPFNLLRFTSDPVMQEVHRAIDAEYPNLSELQKELETAFSYVHYHFPEFKAPRIVALQTGFYAGVLDFDSIVTISLEMYLGPDKEVVQRLSPQDFPQYMKELMKREYISVDVMTNWLTNRFYTQEVAGITFSSNIIFHGKMMYLLDAVLREYPDERKLKYTKEDLEWCIANEYNIWKVIIEGNMLHTADELAIHQWLTEAPFTSDLPRESPARVGQWLGWQMVKAYVKEHPEMTPAEIMAVDYQDILKAYKPKRTNG